MPRRLCVRSERMCVLWGVKGFGGDLDVRCGSSVNVAGGGIGVQFAGVVA